MLTRSLKSLKTPCCNDEVTQSPPRDVLLRSEIVHLGITILVFGHILSCVFGS